MAGVGRSGRRGRVAAPSLLAGVLLALSLPSWGWWPLGFAGAALLYRVLAGLPLRARLLSGWLAGLGCYGVGLYWTSSFNWYGAVVLIAVEALSMGAAAVLVPPGRGRLPAFVGAFTLLEAVRMAWPFGGLPIGGVFLGQAGGPLLCVARVGGPLLLTAVVWLGGAGLGELAGRKAPSPAGGEGGHRTPPSRVAGVGALACVLALGIWGAVAPDGGPAVRHVTVATIQGGGRRGTSDLEVPPATVFAAQLGAMRLMAREDRGRSPQLVVWPEDVIALDRPLAGSSAGATMSSLARRLRTTIVAGVTQTVSSTAFRNEVVEWGPDGRIVGVFEKVHRVPFGEYVPYRNFFAHFANLDEVPLDAIPGHGSGLLRTPAGPIGVMISFEVFYADRSLPSVRAGAQLLVVPTNTSSYASTQVPTQEVAVDRIQAVEEGRDLVQAAPAGYSTVVDHDGDVLQRSVLGRRQVLLATVSLRTGRTLYSRLGDLPVLVAMALALADGWATARWRRRRHRAPAGT
jgi:apolipoprotein N-acyltransferase